MTLLRNLLFLFIGMVTSMVFMSVAFQIDFRVFVVDAFERVSQNDSYATATLIAPDHHEAMMDLRDMQGIKVNSQINLHRNLSNLVHLTGIVPDWQAYETIESLCESMFPDSELKNQVQVFRDASVPVWMASLEGMSDIPYLQKVRNANIGVTEGLIEMTGTVSCQVVRDAALARIAELDQRQEKTSFVVQLSVEAIAPVVDLWLATGDTVLLQGALGSEAKKSLASQINRYLQAGRRLIESIETNDDIQEPTWLEPVQAMIPDLLVNTTASQLKVKDGSLLLRGSSGSSETVDAFHNYLQRAFEQTDMEIDNGLQYVQGENSGEVVSLNTAEAVSASHEGLSRVVASSTIFYGSGSTRLGSQDQRKLTKLGSLLKDDESLSLEIVGHCDPSGDATLNAKLADRRCQSVRAFLGDLGVDLERLRIKAIGSEGKSGGRASDQRRVEFKIASSSLVFQEVDESTALTSVTTGAAVQHPSQAEQLLKSTQIFFDTAQSTIKLAHKRELKVLAEHLKSLEALPAITIRGLADPRGNEAYNRELSRRRCEAVFNHLQSLGVDTSTMRLDERGATEADVSDPDALRKSRRVEFVVKPDAVVAA